MKRAYHLFEFKPRHSVANIVLNIKVENMSNTSSGVILISLLILSIAKPLSLLWFIVDLKYVFMRFNELNDRSEVAVVTDAIHYVSIAWDEIKPEVIKNCFNKAYFGNVSQEDPHILDSDEFRDFEKVYPGYTSIDDQLITNEALELEEIINQATVNDEPDEPSEEEYIPPLPSIASTVQSISTLRQALTATDGSENMLLYLGRVENFLLNKYKNNVLKQPTITTFFNPRK
ncbi:hypothetical protein QTP88_017536 [Uroleucon formosanum]